jgi:hypothetical protein
LASLVDGGLAKLLGVRVTTIVFAVPAILAAGLVLATGLPSLGSPGPRERQASTP